MTGALVEITITPRLDSELVEIVGTRTGRCLQLQLPVGKLEAERESISGALRRLKDNVGSSLGPSTDDVRSALRDLFMRTLRIAFSLTNGPAGIEDLRRVFVEALPDWASTEDIPLVQIEAPSAGFPFELLPVFDISGSDDVTDVEVFARRFLGFTAAVRRVPYSMASESGLPTEQVMRSKPLPLSFAWYQPMGGAREEYVFLRRLSPHLEINGPWPTTAMPSKAVLMRLAEGLADPRRRYAVTNLNQAIQIHHFACHCDTRFEDPADYDLEISASDGVGQRITLGELNMAFVGCQQVTHEEGRPLVFLNACGSAHLDSRTMYSWPEWFLQTRHRCVIGPETLIPDRVAAYYARYFYQALFAQRSAGESLVIARRKLLGEFGNPLGLLYVLYGDQAITVEEPIPKEVLND